MTSTEVTSAESTAVVTFQVGIAKVEVWPESRYLHTIYPDGTRVPAAPEDTDEYRAKARDLGYGEDTWAMCFWHELLHSLLAVADGRVASPALWSVAHKTEDTCRELIWKEESEVMKFQRKLNDCK